MSPLQRLEIPHRSRHCCDGQEEFSQGMEYISLISEGEKGAFDRKDYCLDCWKKFLDSQGGEMKERIFWRSRVPVKQSGDVRSLRRDEKALALLKEIYQSDDLNDQVQAFVLALLLARSKVLQFKQEMPSESGAILLYEVPKTEEMLCVKKVNLSEIEAETVREIIASKLKSTDE